jgi:hypothetical protein
MIKRGEEKIYMIKKKKQKKRRGERRHRMANTNVLSDSTQHCFHKQEGLSSKPLLLPPRAIFHTR